MLFWKAKSVLFINLSDDDTYVPRPEERPLTKFEKRGHRLGHGVWDMLYQKNNPKNKQY